MNQSMTEEIKQLGITSCQLKWIGLITMLIDHIGLIFFPQLWILDVVGRISFPIFAFTTAIGFMYTKNIVRYGLRLLLFAIISEPFYDLALFGTAFYSGRQNVLFTFALGVLMLYCWIRSENLVLRCISVLIILLASELLAVDYNSMGLLMILFFYCFFNENLKRDIAIALINILLMGGRQLFAVLSLIPLHFYRGEKGKDMRAVFYLFYPLHFAVLAGIRWLIIH